jgi:hypothetical protein
MKPRTLAPLIFALASTIALAEGENSACGRLLGASGAAQPDGSFRLRSGEPVDFVGGGRTVHGVLANAGANGTRLISTPPQGNPADDDQPGTTLQPLNVLSCPAL